jgi:uncharacterized protein DUF397
MARPVPPDQGALAWRIARNCNGGACIRVAPSGKMIVLGDSKNPDGPVLRYTRSEWGEFIAGVKHGDFDGL